MKIFTISLFHKHRNEKRMNTVLKILQLLFTKKKKETITISDRITKTDTEIVVGEKTTLSVGRIVATALTTASVAVVSMVQTNEGYRENAYKDSVNVNTIGYGTTKYRTGDKAGQAVKIGDTITKEQARAEVVAYLDEQGQRIVDSLKKPNGEFVELYQEELDIIQDFVYNFGIGNWTKSSIRQAYLDGDYILACENYLKYKYAGGKDCSIRSNNCYGVWLRSQKRRDDCLQAGG